MNITNTYIKKISKLSPRLTKNIYKARGKIYAYAPYNPVIYTFDDRILKPVYKIKFGEFKFPSKDYLDSITKNDRGFISALSDSEYVSHYEIFETGNVLNIYYFVSQHAYLGLHNKRTGETYNLSKQYFENKMKIGNMNKPCGRINDYVVSTLLPSNLREKINEGYNLDPCLETLISSNNDSNNNPILFLYKFKI